MVGGEEGREGKIGQNWSQLLPFCHCYRKSTVPNHIPFEKLKTEGTKSESDHVVSLSPLKALFPFMFREWKFEGFFPKVHQKVSCWQSAANIKNRCSSPLMNRPQDTLLKVSNFKVGRRCYEPPTLGSSFRTSSFHSQFRRSGQSQMQQREFHHGPIFNELQRCEKRAGDLLVPPGWLTTEQREDYSSVSLCLAHVRIQMHLTHDRMRNTEQMVYLKSR